MPQLHLAPYKDAKVVPQILKFLPETETEEQLAFYDSTVFLNKDIGLLLTRQRLIQFKKRNVLQQVSLSDISEITYEEKEGEAADLTIRNQSHVLRQEFKYFEELRIFLTTLSKYVTVNTPIPASRLEERVEALRSAPHEPAVSDYLYSCIPVMPGEDYLAYYAKQAKTGLLLTTHRLIWTEGGYITWVVFMDAIKRVKVVDSYLNIADDQHSHQPSLETNSNAHAMCRLIAEAKGRVPSAMGSLDFEKESA
ncbi:MAG: hypothetical protein H6672_06980 [Anaerolineaceae bacterium]|nr:hypothetical protein [Anaerolineaceae bacterium]